MSTCESARDWLMQADKPANFGAAPAEVAAHVGSCAECQGLIQEVERLEVNWRNLSDSPQSESAKSAFLKRLEQPAMPVARSENPRRWRQKMAWVCVAALFVVAGAAILFYWPTQQPVQAQSDVIEQLVDWNLELTEAPTPAERERIFFEKHEKLKVRIKQVKLNDAERELAENLLANGVWLAKNDDPVEELSHFNRMADRLLEKMKNAAERADALQSEKLAKQYAKIAERGIDGNLERIKVAKAIIDPERRLKIKQMLKEDKDRDVVLLVLIDRASVQSQKEMRKALELSDKRHKIRKLEK